MKRFSSFLSLVILSNSILSANAALHYSNESEFWNTQTGSYVHAMHPLLKPEDAVKSSIDQLISGHTEELKDSIDFSKKQEEIERIYKRIEPLLQNEIDRKSEYVFYHGHSNELGLYIDLLKEVMDQFEIKPDTPTNPFRLKTGNNVRNIREFLEKFDTAFQKDAKTKKGKYLKLGAAFDEPQTQEQKPFNGDPYLQSNRLVAYAPDLIDWARKNLLCVNLNMFGNTNPGQTSLATGESTFLYFLKSFNIGNPNEFLIKQLLEITGLGSGEPAIFQTQVDVYKKLYIEKFQKAGGGLIQIFMKNNEVDQLGYASEARGVPVLVNQDGNYVQRRKKSKFITRLKPDEYQAPKLSHVIDLYKKDPRQFAKKYSDRSDLREFDRMQARLFVSKDFMDPQKITVNRIFLNEIKPDSLSQYQSDLKAQVRSDIQEAIFSGRLTKEFYKLNTALSKIMRFVYSKSALGLKKIASLVQKTDTTSLKAMIETISIAIEKTGVVAKNIMQNLKILSAFAKVKEAFSEIGTFSYKMMRKAYHAIVNPHKPRAKQTKIKAKAAGMNQNPPSLIRSI